MDLGKQSFLETNPRWLSVTFTSSAAALVITGVGVFFGLASTFVIGPFTLLLHLVWATAISTWIVNLKTKMAREKKVLLAVGAAMAVGSVWSSIQQWLAFTENGVVNDLILVVGAMLMDAVGGSVTYILYHLNILKK